MSNRQTGVSQLVTGASMGADVTSDVYDTRDYDRVALQVVWSAGATPVGTVAIQGSLDGTNFVAMNVGTLSVAGNADHMVVDLTEMSLPFIRVLYTRTSGSGTMNVFLFGKGY